MAFNYAPSATGQALHQSDKFCKMILGPYGSGKSCACVVDLLTYACAQAASSDGVRYSRWGVIRATYPELAATTRRSLIEVLPATHGGINQTGAPIRGFYHFPLPDGTQVHLELELFALQAPEDAEKLRSVNWTGCLINEATGVAREIFSMAITRVGRYPSASMGGISYAGVIMDFNMPPHGSWLDTLIKDLPDDYVLFRQPSAAIQSEDAAGKKVYTVNLDAENLWNLGAWQEGDPTAFATDEERSEYLTFKGARYYKQQIDDLLRAGREDVVQNMYCMLDVPIVEGKPVYSGFSYARHVAPAPVDPLPFVDVIIGMDQSGIHPAAVLLQNHQGRWVVLDEIFAENEGFENFLHGILIPLLRTRYATNPVVAAIDPSNQRDSYSGITPKTRLEDAGIPAVSEFTNSPKARIQCVEAMLNLDIGGLLISPTCEMLIRGFVSEYRYRRLRASGTIGTVYTPAPEKNSSSHYHDSLQYAALLIRKGSQTNDSRLSEHIQYMARKRETLARVM